MPNMRFRLGFIPHIAFHHLLEVVLVIAIVLFALVIAGCSSSSVSSIYLTSLSYEEVEARPLLGDGNHNLTATFKAIVNDSSLHVRTGFWGLCVSKGGSVWQCDNNVNKLAPLYQLPDDPLNLLAVSGSFKDGIFFPGLHLASIALAFISIIALSSFPGWHEEIDENGSERDVKPFPSRPVAGLAFATSAVAAAIGVISMLWQHTASVAAASTAQNMAYGTVRSQIGLNAMALGWAGLVCLIISTVCQMIMSLGYNLLDELTE